MTTDNETAVVKATKEPLPAWYRDGATLTSISDRAQIMAASGLFPDTVTLASAAAKILIGSELGFGSYESMAYIYLLKTNPPRVELGYQLVAALLNRSSRYRYEVEEHDNLHCRIAFYAFRGGSERRLGVSTFTWDQAVKAGLSTKSTWASYPETMLFSKALKNGCKWYAPDVLGGVDVATEEPYIEGVVRELPAEVTEAPEGERSPWPGFWARCRERGQSHGFVHDFVGVGREDGDLKRACEQKGDAENLTLAEVLAELEERLVRQAAYSAPAAHAEFEIDVPEARSCTSRASPNANAGSCTFDAGHSGPHSWHPDRQLDTAPVAGHTADTPTCETCNVPMKWQQGEKDGKQWQGWFCRDYKRGQESHPVIWAKSRAIDALPAHKQQAAYEADEDAAQTQASTTFQLYEVNEPGAEPVHERDPWPPFWTSVEAIGEGLMHPDATFVFRVAQVRDMAQLREQKRSASVLSKRKGGKAPREVGDLLGDLLLRVSRAWAAGAELRADPPVPTVMGDTMMRGPGAPAGQGRMA
jgi:hypothetical protein